MKTLLGQLNDLAVPYQAIDKLYENDSILAVKHILTEANHKLAIKTQHIFKLHSPQEGHELLSLTSDERIKFIKEWGKQNNIDGLLILGVQ